jgi:hypothetical protein
MFTSPSETVSRNGLRGFRVQDPGGDILTFGKRLG